MYQSAKKYVPKYKKCPKVPKSTELPKNIEASNSKNIKKVPVEKYQSTKVPKNQSNNATTRYLYGLDFGQAPVQNRAHISSVTMQQCTKIPK